jgi:ribosomal protein S12 methylthiotransferase
LITKRINKTRINIVTLGCSKNIYDSELLLTQLNANNYEVIFDSENNNSPIVIINTCGFIDDAKEESINTILEYVKAKERGKIEKLFVTGCLSERYKLELEKEIPNVDRYFGTQDLHRLLRTLGADYKKELVGERLLTTPRHYAYFKISEGCDKPCSFCAIPLMRGKHVSIPKKVLVKQAQNLTNKGVKELILIAQDLTYYGLDIYGKRTLADLLKRLSDIKGLEWIRLHYAFPSGFPMDVLDVMRERENICKYLDIPLQHINNRILLSMRRGITKEKTIELINEIRKRVPDIAIRTTLITGYPGETELEFEELAKWVKDTKFERLGVFTYSHEEQTYAYKMKDDVPMKIKKQRAKKIMNIQRKISQKHNESLIGKTLKVLLDRVEGDYYIGRTEFDSPEIDNEVLIKKGKMKIGQFVKVKITEADEYDLYGDVKKNF